MFLFEGYFGNILHTGDCRLTPECLQNLPEKYLSKKGKEPKCSLDIIFLDCTFGKSYLKMPSKYLAIRQVINSIWKHPDAPTVYLACDLLGQEDILVEVSRTFGSKIYVDKIDSAEFFQALTLTAPDIISEDESSRFQVFKGFSGFYERAKVKLTEARATSRTEPLFIRPSAQWYACEIEYDVESQRKHGIGRTCKDSFGVWHVCYSMHSSREELEWALQLLHPKRVISTTTSCRAMELNYVKTHCLSTQVTSDDPLWKLMGINIELGSVPPQAFLLEEVEVTSLSSSSNVEGSQPIYSEANQLKSKSIFTSRVNLGLNLSPPSTRSPITLFGRARLSLENSTVRQDETEVSPINVDFANSYCSTENGELPLQVDVTVEVQCKKSEDKEIEVVKSSLAGSSKSFSASLRKLYRSMNVPVPRPLPSLMELMEGTKRVRRKL